MEIDVFFPASEHFISFHHSPFGGIDETIGVCRVHKSRSDCTGSAVWVPIHQPFLRMF